MKHLTSVLCLLGAVAAMAVSSAALADETNPDIIHRQGIYQIVGGHMTALRSALMLNNEKTHPQVEYHVQGIIEAFKRMGDAYPESSRRGITRASAAIWEKPDEFRQAGQNSFAAANKMLEVVQQDGSRRQIMASFRDLGGSCRACHDDFRERR